MQHIHVILGTKAQLIKMAPILAEFQRRGLSYNFILTGQHKETVEALRDNFGVKEPDYVLYDGPDITGTGRMLTWLGRCAVTMLRRRRSIFGGRLDRGHVVLVHGDTVSTLLGAVVGRLLGARVAHVESGLRSFDYLHPFPEEITRVLTFRFTHIFFCPGAWAVVNLRRFGGVKIDTGQNTLFDCLQLARERMALAAGPRLPDVAYGVCTLHRFENVYKRPKLEWMVATLGRIARRKRLLFILHPVTEKQLRRWGLLDTLAGLPGIELRPRMDYFNFIRLVDGADFVISDGGSNQEENYYLGKPCLLLRKASERVEGIGENCVLSGYDDGVIDEFVAHFERYRRPPVSLERSPAAMIVDYLQQEFAGRRAGAAAPAGR